MTVLAHHSRDRAALDELSSQLVLSAAAHAARLARLIRASESALARARSESSPTGGVVVAPAGCASPPG